MNLQFGSYPQIGVRHPQSWGKGNTALTRVFSLARSRGLGTKNRIHLIDLISSLQWWFWGPRWYPPMLQDRVHGSERVETSENGESNA